MNIKEKLTILRNHFATNRKVGHTSLMKYGLVDNDFPKNATVVVKALGYFNNLGLNTSKVREVSLDSLNFLRGREEPIVIDHEALRCLFSEALEKIDLLEDRIIELQEETDSVWIRSSFVRQHDPNS